MKKTIALPEPKYPRIHNLKKIMNKSLNIIGNTFLLSRTIITHPQIIETMIINLPENISYSNYKKLAQKIIALIKQTSHDKLTSEQAVIYFAKISAAHDGDQTSNFIKEYGISDQKALIEIAKIAAAGDSLSAFGTSLYIQNYGITDQKALIEIAKIAAAGGKVGTLGTLSLYIQNYGITDEKARVEIAKIAATKNGKQTSTHIKNYNISDSIERSKIFLTALLQDNRAYKHIDAYEIQPLLMAPLFLAESPTTIKENLHLLPLEIQQLISNIKNNRHMIDASRIAAFIVEIHHLHHLPVDTAIISTLINLRTPTLRLNLTQKYGNIVSDPLFQQNISSHEKESTFRKEELWLRAIAIHGLPTLYPTLMNLKIKSRDNQKLLLHGLLIAEADSQKEAIAELINKTIDGINNQQQITHILSILTIIRELTSMKIEIQEQDLISLDTLKAKHKASFFSEMNLSSINDFEHKYDTTLRKSRRPQALLTYSSLVKTRSDIEQKLWSNYITDILNSTFKINRYKDNIHVAKLSTNQIKEWTKGAIIDLNPISDQTKTENFDIFAYLKTKLIIDKHLGDLGDFAFLKKFLESSEIQSHEIETTIESLKNIMDSSQDHKMKLSVGKVITQQKLAQALIASMDTKLLINEQIQQLKLAIKLFASITQGQDHLFKQDLIVAVNQLSGGKITNLDCNGWTVADTDEPEDLLLVGTEVDGSCQRVDGEDANKGLIAYIMDGKYRALVIKNEKGHIVARAMIRMMWDKKEKKPVLFMERTYTQNGVNLSDADAWLSEFAINRAKSLGLMLVRVSTEFKSTGPNLESLGGPAPFEYIDALGGLFSSEYYIPSTGILWKPEIIAN